MIDLATTKKKVAIVGGGPAGMKAALVAAARGHSVTLYEKSDALGGLLKTTDDVPFKWPQREFKDWLVYQVGKADIDVCLNTDATAEMLKEKEYDVVLVAVGSEPLIPPIPGADGKNVICAADVYGKENSLDKKVVIVGGGEVGVETGIQLARHGHEVTVIEMLERLATNSAPAHTYTMFQEAWESEPNFHYVLKACCESIEAGKVTYTDADGKKQTIEAGSVVMAVGMKPKTDLVMKFVGAADKVINIGDCVIAGNIQKSLRSAYSIASTI
jgi:pyruvate/2-oxoglutarate dehydrogenase complex dihydrolipoamide dehydrogenase (E3) component